MNQRSQSQYLVWAGIALAAVVGVGLIAFLWGLIFNNSEGGLLGSATATPAPSPTPIVVTVSGISSQAKLATVQYTTVAEVYKENLPEGWLDEVLGRKEQLLMLVYGDVQAGFDMEKLKEEDLWTDGTRARLVLPAPEILSASINFNRTHIVYYENNLLLEKNNPNLQGEALEEAQKAVKQAALQEEILQRANEYGKVYYENFLYSLGFTDVEVIVDAQIFEK